MTTRDGTAVLDVPIEPFVPDGRNNAEYAPIDADSRHPAAGRRSPSSASVLGPAEEAHGHAGSRRGWSPRSARKVGHLRRPPNHRRRLSK
jgi:hypothetical protein